MKKNGFYILSLFMLISACATQKDSSQKIWKIMPVGNSITAGEHYRLPPVEERTGYRKPLCELLDSAGIKYDMVGSTHHGKKENSEDWYDWNSESYPGWEIDDIADTVLKVLPISKPDVMLLHVGTNGRNWNDKPEQLNEFLNGINDFALENNQNITVFVALILDFFDSNPDVSIFNQKVKELLKSRKDDVISIVPVDMEKEAGIDYSDNDPDPESGYPGGDMWGTKYPGVEYDFAHPNDRGNKKMAIKWFEALKKELHFNQYKDGRRNRL